MNQVEDERIIVGPLELRPSRYLALLDGQVLALSQRELGLLTVLARRRGDIVSRSELCQLAWGRELSRNDRTVDVYVHKLRRRLEAALPDLRFIHTHHRIGYRLDPQPAPSDRHAGEAWRPAPAPG